MIGKTEVKGTVTEGFLMLKRRAALMATLEENEAQLKLEEQRLEELYTTLFPETSYGPLIITLALMAFITVKLIAIWITP